MFKNLIFFKNFCKNSLKKPLSFPEVSGCYFKAFVIFKNNYFFFKKNYFEYNNFPVGSNFTKQYEIKIIKSIQFFMELEMMCKKNFNTKKNFLIFNSDIELKIFNFLQKKKIVKNYRISILSNAYILAVRVVIYLYSFLNIFLIPEFLLLKIKEIKTKKNYKIVHNIDMSAILNRNNFMNKIFFENSKIINVVRYQYNKKCYLKLKKKTEDFQNVLILNDSVNLISKKKYITKFYSKLSLRRFYYCKKLNLFNSKILLKTFTEKNLWEIFFSNFKPKIAINVMTHSEINEQYMQKKFIEKRIFIYLSSNDFYYSKRFKFKKIPDNLQYSYMDYDVLICNKFSEDFFNHTKNNFNLLKDYGCIRNNFFLNKKQKIIKKNNRLIVFYDGTFGYSSLVSQSQYIKYLKFIHFFMLSNPSLSFYLKIKETNCVKVKKNLQIFKLITKIKNLKNYLNFSDIQVFEISKHSALNVSMAQSSVINELLLSRNKVLIFDNCNFYKNIQDHVYQKLNIICYSEFELARRISKDLINKSLYPSIKDVVLIKKYISITNNKILFKKFARFIST
jgi:hypothetical protein